MSDYTGDFFLDPGIVIKQEPLVDNSMNTSASVPIPARRDMNDYRNMAYDFESSLSSSFPEASLMNQIQATSDGVETNILWGNRIVGLDVDLSKSDAFIHMDDDDIFQVDKADLIQGPTLAELNANDETLLGDLNFDDLLLPEENSYNYMNGVNTSNQQKFDPALQLNNNNSNHLNNNCHTVTASSCPQTGLGFYRDSLDLPSSISSNPLDIFATKNPITTFSPTSQTSSSPSTILQSIPSPVPSNNISSSLQHKHSTLHELLMKRENYCVSPDRNVLGQSVPGQNSHTVGSVALKISRAHTSRLSSSAPTHLGLDQIWQRREPRKHLLSTGSLAEAGSTSSLSTGGVLSPDPQDFSHDELESDEDSEHYEDFSSDNGDSDDEIDDHGIKLKELSGSKKERYFWQYNVQAKGPKGQRLVMKCKMEDPHVLHEVTDPVFSPDCSVRGIKHSGKARKGDGNDLTPNARKLFNIGKELDKLGRIINDMTPVSELPFNVRPKTRKEKNKLASRACRLKKKAQHEANKIKLQGLEHEHKRLLNGISQAKQVLAAKLSESSAENQEELSMHMDKVVKNATKIKIAGQTTEYVNKILDKIRGGNSHPAALDDL